MSRLFRTSDLMICPIENDYGVKFKALEALAYGTPLLASRQTMSGLPHLRGIPSLDLRNPTEAATLVAGLLNDRDRAISLASAQQQQQDAFISTQYMIWSRVLRFALFKNIPAAILPSQLGIETIAGDGRLADRNSKAGYLTFGPYASLPRGKYRIVFKYGPVSNRQHWDIVLSRCGQGHQDFGEGLVFRN